MSRLPTAPPQVSISRAVTLRQIGGDTVRVNTAATYEELSPALKALASSLWEIHTNDDDYGAIKFETDQAG